MNRPTNPLVNALLTDMYQITMVYADWCNGRHEDIAVFDLFFRKNPFKGEYTIFAGLEEALRYVSTFGFTDEDIDYLRTLMPHAEAEFFEWLRAVDTSKVTILAGQENTPWFPRVPMIQVIGPVSIGRLLETTLLNLINFPSLVATNAARMRYAAGPNVKMIEYGLRRAQGPDGAISASRYSYMAGFDGTSNVEAGKLFGIPVKGTHAHSFVSSFSSLDQVSSVLIPRWGGTREKVPFLELVLKYRSMLQYNNTNDGELAAFIAYANAFPSGMLALVDTYDTLSSGVPNFICVALALIELGYKPLGIRLDSGDLAYLSDSARAMFIRAGAIAGHPLGSLDIFASNDINEEILWSLQAQGHQITAFGIGTNLVTCQAQPALGCIYKLVEINGEPKIKVSQDPVKVTLPARKRAFRLYDKNGIAICDLITLFDEDPPKVSEPVLCCHPAAEHKRMWVIPSEVKELLTVVWDGANAAPSRSLNVIREMGALYLHQIRDDHRRALNPTPYKVSVSQNLFSKLHKLWTKEIPIPVVS